MQQSLTCKIHNLVNTTKSSKLLLLFSLLEYAVHKTSYIWSKFPHFSISSNINLQQDGVRMYPSRDIMFISALINSFVLYVKRSILWLHKASHSSVA